MKAADIRKIACIGSGLIGANWATNFIMKGYGVNLYDVNSRQLENARAVIENNMRFLVSKNVIPQQEADKAVSLLTFTSNIYEAVNDVLFIQESGPEKYEVKQEILAAVEENTHDSTIFASSTSGLLITEIAKYAKHPERCLGAHPYNPVHLIPLVEISKGSKTSEETINCTCDLYRLLDKEPVILQKEALGFIANRLQVALYREAVDLVVRGVCSVEDVDKASLYGPGLRFGIMGPNLIFQLGGGAHGIKGLLHHIGPSVELWWADMADWKKWPANWGETAQNGVNEEMSKRPPAFGRTNEEAGRFRDDMLIELLRLHKKL